MRKLKTAKDLFKSKSKTTSNPNTRIGKAVVAGVKAIQKRTLPTVTVTAKKKNK